MKQNQNRLTLNSFLFGNVLINFLKTKKLHHAQTKKRTDNTTFRMNEIAPEGKVKTAQSLDAAAAAANI